MFKLAPQQFASIFEALRNSASSAGSDKRQSTRMDVQAKVAMSIIRDGRVVRSYTALTRDVSAAGIGVFQHVPLENGERFLVTFPTAKGENLVLECVARFCRPLAEGMFGVGGQFERIAPEELITQINDMANSTLSRLRDSILN